MAAPSELSLDRYVSDELPFVKGLIRDSKQAPAPGKRPQPGKNFYETVCDTLSDGTRHTSAQITYLEAYETALSVFRTSSQQIRNAMKLISLENRLQARKSFLDELSNSSDTAKKEAQEFSSLTQEVSDARMLSNRYALAFAGYVGLSIINSKKPEEITLGFALGKYDPSADKDAQTKGLSAMAISDFQRVTSAKTQKGEKLSDDELKFTLEGIFSTWINQFSYKTFEDVAKARSIEDLTLRYRSFSIKKGEFKEKSSLVQTDGKFMFHTKDDVIGGESLGTTLWQNFIKLSAYDLEKRKNPYKPAKVIFTFGDPGCGKTFISHGYINSFIKECEKRGIPLWAFTHSVTDYSSVYQNKTQLALAELGKQIEDFPGPVIMYVADADTLFQSRNRPGITVEQTNTIGVYLKMFDGTLIRSKGKFLAVMDANYIDGIDPATRSRLFDEIIELRRFDKPEDFARLAKMTLLKDSEGIVIPETQWLDIGKHIFNTPLSNREVDSVLSKITRGFVVPETMMGASFKEHADYRNAKLQEILTMDKIINNFDQYLQTRAAIQNANDEARMRADEDKVARFLENLAKPGPDLKDSGGK